MLGRSVIICFTMGMLLLLIPGTLSAAPQGTVTAKSSDLNLKLYGEQKLYPTFISNPDFNDSNTPYNYLGEESGAMDGYSIRSQTRVGILGNGANWTFNIILEGDFNLNRSNTDHAGTPGDYSLLQRNSKNFGIEKLRYTYNFSESDVPITLKAGWFDDYLDIETGGLLYGDDHPTIGLYGNTQGVSWKIFHMLIDDEIAAQGGNPNYNQQNILAGQHYLGGYPKLDADKNDWYVTAFRAEISKKFQTKGKTSVLKFNPIYAYSDNRKRDSSIHYAGLQMHGKLGKIVPRTEFIYAYGEKEDDLAVGGVTHNPDGTFGGVAKDADINAYAAHLALHARMNSKFKPYIGGNIVSGDDDAHDDEINAFNSITNTSRWTPTFGGSPAKKNYQAMENAFIYRLVPALGSFLYSNTPSTLGQVSPFVKSPSQDPYSGYGGSFNSGSANSPGMMNLGIGAEGDIEKISYKAQFRYFWFQDTGALEDYIKSNNVLEKSQGDAFKKQVAGSVKDYEENWSAQQRQNAISNLQSSEPQPGIDDTMGWEADFLLSYNFSSHFALGNLISIFNPGDGIQEYNESLAQNQGYGKFDEMAYQDSIHLIWSF